MRNAFPSRLFSRKMSSKLPPKRKPFLGVEGLEDRLTPAAPFPEFIDPNPNPGNQFGATVVALSTGNVVITSPFDDFAATDAGAVYLFNGATGALISTLRGSTADDKIGGSFRGVTALTNGNYVVSSPFWDNGAVVDAGAATFGSGTTGISGAVSAANSLVGTTNGDFVGDGIIGSGGIDGVTALTNGNYVVRSPRWNNGAVIQAGAATFGSGTTGISGAVSAANSLVGTTNGDLVGFSGVTALTNGNYVVSSSFSNGAVVGAGAATFGSGTTGISGAVSAANSLVGTTALDQVGTSGVTALTNGNYVVRSPRWNNVGAATFGSGTTGISGAVSAANSLVGTTNGDSVGDGDNFVGNLGVTALTNGNYVVSSRFWDNGAVVNAGAATFGSGTTGISGPVSVGNSLVGTTANDQVSDFGVTALTNGNYVVRSPNWDNGAVGNAGAATFGSGTTGISGAVSAANSLVGTTFNDQVGGFGGSVTALANGNYVVSSGGWDNGAVVGAGAATFGSGTTGISGAVSAANSLVGTTNGDGVGEGGPISVTALTNGNYVVRSAFWDNGAVVNAGAATFGSGTTGISGAVSAANSLVGTTANDFVGFATALTNGNYVVSSAGWDNGAVVDAGAATFGSGTTGISGAVSAANSLVGTTANDFVGRPTALTNGNYVVISPNWDNGAVVDAGAATFGSGTAGVTGSITTLNSVVGLAANTGLRSVVADKVNGTFFASFVTEGGGRVRLGSQDDGFVPNVNLSVSANAGTEAGATIITVTATATAPVTGDQTVTLAVTGAGITTGDFTLSNAAITILSGQTTGTVTFAVVNDTLVEPVETATLTISNPSANIALGATTTQNIAITSDEVPPPPPGTVKPVLVGFPQFGVGSDKGSSNVLFYNPDGSVRFSVAPFAGFTGGVRTASADFNGDGVADLIVGTGPGIATRVVILDGKSQSELFAVDPFEASFTGGVYVSAGDVTGDGIPDLAITPDEGGGPRVDIYSGAAGFPKVTGFFGIDDMNFRGGARSSIADMTGDGVADLIVVAGFGGGPRVAAFEGKSLSTRTPVKIFGDFFAFEQALRNGIFVTAGDINGDGFADLIAGGGPGGGPRVLAFDGKSLLNNEYVNLANFFGGDVDSRGGIRVAVKDLDGDNRADLVVGSGSGAGSRVTGYLGKNIAVDGTPTTQFDFDSISGFTGGVFVG